MRIPCLFSVQHFVVLLASLSTVLTVYAAPVGSEYATLKRRAETILVKGKVAELGKQLSSERHEKSRVYRLTKWDNKPNPGYVIKIYSHGARVKQMEIEGLTAAGQYIAADPNTHSIVMKEVTGTPLAELAAKVPHDQRREFFNHWKPIVAKEVARIAHDYGILHDDLNMNNVLVSGQSVHLIDWEHVIKRDDDSKGQFMDNEKDIEAKLNLVWDSSQTPPEYKKSSSSPTASGEKPPSPRKSPKKS